MPRKSKSKKAKAKVSSLPQSMTIKPIKSGRTGRKFKGKGPGTSGESYRPVRIGSDPLF